jgi:hypothetical protein
VPLTISSIVISGGNAPADYAWGGNCPISPNTLALFLLPLRHRVWVIASQR